MISTLTWAFRLAPYGIAAPTITTNAMVDKSPIPNIGRFKMYLQKTEMTVSITNPLTAIEPTAAAMEIETPIAFINKLLIRSFSLH